MNLQEELGHLDKYFGHIGAAVAASTTTGPASAWRQWQRPLQRCRVSFPPSQPVRARLQRYGGTCGCGFLYSEEI